MKKNRKKYLKDFTQEELNKMSFNELEDIKMTTYIHRGIIGVIIAIIVIFGLVTFFNSFTTVETGFVGVKTRFGQVQDTVIQEGLNTKAPFVEKIVKIDCRTKKVEISNESSTKDMQVVNVTIALNYNVQKENANKLYKEVGTDYESIIINPAILESIKSSMAQYTAEELITKRAEVSAKIQETLINKLANRSFDITEFNITNIDFSDAFNNAIETKAVKQQEVVAAKADLEKQEIQNQKEISIAEKDARVMELQNQQITDKTLDLKRLEVQEKMIDKWNGALPATNLGDNIPMINLGK